MSGPTNLIAVPPEATGIVAIAAGKYHILALRADGAIIAWGDNSAGQTSLPVLTNVIAVAAGGYQSLALVGPPAPRLGAGPKNLTVGEAFAASFNFAAAGAPPLSASWLFNGTNLVGPRSLFCPIPDARLADAGQYTLLLSNTWGMATGTVSLTVTSSAPAMVVQPVGLVAGAGSNVTLSVRAVGTEPLSYQWQRDGLPLADGAFVQGAATPALTLLNVQTNDTGNYAALVTNVVGSTLSATGRVTVLPGPTLGVAVNAPNLDWTTGGDSAWRYQTNTTHDGLDAAWSGTLTQPGTAWLQTQVTGPIVVGFWWKVASTFESLNLGGGRNNLGLHWPVGGLAAALLLYPGWLALTPLDINQDTRTTTLDRRRLAGPGDPQQRHRTVDLDPASLRKPCPGRERNVLGRSDRHGAVQLPVVAGSGPGSGRHQCLTHHHQHPTGQHFRVPGAGDQPGGRRDQPGRDDYGEEIPRRSSARLRRRSSPPPA